MNGNTKLKRLNISHYGPLKDIDIEFNDGFNAFYGRNESGKTLLVEAITSMLTDKEFGRISQSPNGFMTVEKNDEEFDAFQEGLEQVIGEVTAEDVKNAFVIRDADLRRPEKTNSFGSKDYYRDVTDRVLGSRTKKIESLRNKIADNGYLTNSSSDAKLENTKSTGKLRDHRDDAEELIDKIDLFIDEIAEENVYSKFNELNALQEKIETQRKLIERIKEAEKQQKYNEGRKLIQELKKTEEKIRGLKDEENELEELKEIRLSAEQFEEVNEDLESLKYASIGSGVLSGLSLFALAFNPIGILAGLSLVFLSVSGYSFYRYRGVKNTLAERETERNSIIEEAKARGLNADTLAEVTESIKNYADEVREELEAVRGKRQEKIGELKGKFNASVQEVEDWEAILEDFSEEFESRDENFEQTPQEARRKLEELEEERKSIEKEIESHRNRLDQLDRKFSDTLIERFIDEEPVDIKSVEDLEKASRQLKDCLDNLSQTVESSVKAIEILEEMEEDEGDEFNRMFQEDSYAVKMFCEATDGNYSDIVFDRDSQELEVIRSDGRTVSPEDLSQGTYDLLYMSIRLGLAREILDEPGFLILDNAFTHSDMRRVRSELEFLETLVEEGWQIIYLTYRTDVRKELEAFTDVSELEMLHYN